VIQFIPLLQSFPDGHLKIPHLWQREDLQRGVHGRAVGLHKMASRHSALRPGGLRAMSLSEINLLILTVCQKAFFSAGFLVFTSSWAENRADYRPAAEILNNK
jgi:hypothetical protein